MVLTMSSIVNLHAQNNPVDSLLSIVKHTSSTSEKLKAYRGLYMAYARSNYDSALHYAQRGFVLAVEVDELHEAAKIKVDMGTAHAQKGEYTIALEEYRTALDYFVELKDLKGQARCWGNMGSTYFFQSDFRAAKENFEVTQALFLELGDTASYYSVFSNSAACSRTLGDFETAIANYKLAIDYFQPRENNRMLHSLYQGIGRTYDDMFASESGEQYHLKANALAVEMNDLTSIANSLYHLAENYRFQGRWEEAEVKYLASLEISIQLGSMRSESLAEQSLASLYLKQQKYTKAKTGFRKAMYLNRKMQNTAGILTVYIGLGDVMKATGKLDSALFFYEAANSLALDMEVPRLLYASYKNLGNVYESMGQPTEALRYFHLYDSVKQTNKGENGLVLLERFRGDLAEKNLLLSEKNTLLKVQQLEIETTQNGRLWSWVISLGMLLALLFFLMLWLRQRNRMRLEQEVLLERDKGLREVQKTDNEVRTRVSQDLHDGVWQLLTDIQHNLHQLTELNADSTYVVKKTALQTLVSEASTEVRSIAHKLQPVSLNELGLEGALKELLRKSLQHTSIAYSIVFYGERSLPQHVEFALYRICQELLNNTIKHAQATEFEVTLVCKEEHVLLAAEDNGIGFSYAANMSTGSGLSNIRNRAFALGGTVGVEQAIPTGQITKIQLPYDT